MPYNVRESENSKSTPTPGQDLNVVSDNVR